MPISQAQELVRRATRHLAAQETPDEALLFSLARMTCQLEAASALERKVSKGDSPELLSQLSTLYSAQSLHSIRSKLSEAPADYGFRSVSELSGDKENSSALSSKNTVELGRAVAASGSVPETLLDESHSMVRDTFRKLADTSVTPIAERIHRNDELIPEELIEHLRDLGCFGLSIPENYGGFQSLEAPDHLGMVIVTEELSRGSLGAAGSLITRPEIVARALIKGGTEGQKAHWLPQIASGETMTAVAVTEPDHGSDVAGLRFTATREKGGWVLNGTKTWCTFAGRANLLGVLARTSTDLTLRHKGLSLFLVEKPEALGHEFHFKQEGGTQGTMEGRAIPTIGYRGMHSFEVKFERWFVPEKSLVGGDAGLGKGFYLQMEGFAAGRLQTAARANGLMHAALEKAISYANDRMVFGKRVADQPASSQKLAFMAATLLASRALTHEAAEKLERPDGSTTAAMAKLFGSQVAEWLTREAQQLHGGMGYAEEFAVSRYFVDARVLSIFEGAEEVLAVKVIAPALLAQSKNRENR